MRRPPVHPWTARALREAHRRSVTLWRLGSPIPEGIALLHGDYVAWRRRVACGEQADTLPPPRGRVVLP